jgi:hypothetical protein
MGQSQTSPRKIYNMLSNYVNIISIADVPTEVVPRTSLGVWYLHFIRSLPIRFNSPYNTIEELFVSRWDLSYNIILGTLQRHPY